MLMNKRLIDQHIYVPDDFPDMQALLLTTLEEWERMDGYHLRQAMLRLSQYHLYVTVLVNHVEQEAALLKRNYEEILAQAAAVQPASVKTLSERRALAQQDPACLAIRQQWEEAEKERALLANVPDAVKELLYSVRKAFDRGMMGDG